MGVARYAHDQTYRDLLGVFFGWLEDGMVTLKIILNERLMKM